MKCKCLKCGKEFNKKRLNSVGRANCYECSPFGSKSVRNNSRVGKSVIKWRQRLKLKAVEYKGGGCSICGYSKAIQALVFHHIDPELKDFTISATSRSFNNIKQELDKCILLCLNCHAETHRDLLRSDSRSVAAQIADLHKWEAGVPLEGSALTSGGIPHSRPASLKVRKLHECPTCGTLSLKQFCTIECRHLFNGTVATRREETGVCVDCNKKITSYSKRCLSCSRSRLRPERNKIDWPPANELISTLRTGSYTDLAKKLGVSSNAIKKHIRKCGMTPPAKQQRTQHQ